MTAIFFQIFPLILMLGAAPLWVGSGVWAYRDAEQRGKPGWLVAGLVLLVGWPISLLVWIALRPENRTPPFDLNRFRVQ